MEIKDTINIAEDFSKELGARYIYEGPFSGELFLQNLLLPRFEKAVNGNYILLIKLDGVLGYPSSFVSGSFGKLSLDKGASLAVEHLEFESSNPLRIEKIAQEIQNPNRKEPQNVKKK